MTPLRQHMIDALQRLGHHHFFNLTVEALLSPIGGRHKAVKPAEGEEETGQAHAARPDFDAHQMVPTATSFVNPSPCDDHGSGWRGRHLLATFAGGSRYFSWGLIEAKWPIL